MNLFETDIQNAINALGQDRLTQALQNVASYQPVQTPGVPATPHYDLNNIGQYFQATPAQQPIQTQLVQQSNPAQNPEPGKIVYKGKTYSANNPVLAMFPTNSYFKPTAPVLMKAQEWENQNAVNQAVVERQRRMDEASSFLVTPELLNSLPQNSVYRDAFQPGQRLPLSQLSNFQKGMDAEAAQHEIQAMLPQVEEAYAKIPDENPYKPMIQFTLQSAVQSGDPKQLKLAYDYIAKTMAYVTPKAQTVTQQIIDRNRAANLVTQINKNRAQNQKILSGGNAKTGSGSKSQLVSFLHKSYDQYLRKTQMEIGQGNDPGKVQDFEAYVAGNDFTANGKQISGAQMLQLYHQELVKNVDTSGVGQFQPAGTKKDLAGDYLRRSQTGSTYKAIIKAINDRESRETIEGLIKRWNSTPKNAKHDLNYWINEARKRK